MVYSLHLNQLRFKCVVSVLVHIKNASDNGTAYATSKKFPVEQYT